MSKATALWLIAALAYGAFILIFSALYPYTLDEYAAISLSGNFSDAVALYAKSYLHHSPKIGALFSVLILYFGKWLFVVLNPFVQLAMVVGIFYFVFLRLPDFKTLKDFPPMLLIALLSLIAVPVPDNTLFWIGGAVNYSWTMLIFLFFLCALRALEAGRNFVPASPIAATVIFLLAVMLGLSNENNAPMAIIIFILFFIWQKYKKTAAPPWFYFAFAGLILGAILLFSAPGVGKRASMVLFAEFWQSPFISKMFIHLNIFNDYLAATLLLPVVNFILLLFLLKEKFKIAVKSKDFILAFLCWGIALGLAGVLFLAPLDSTRTFYSAAVFSFISFILLIKFMQEVYKVNIFRYLAVLLLIIFIVLLPAFTLPYINLYKQETKRMQEVKTPSGSTTFLNRVRTVKGPTQNLSIHYYDSVVQYKFIQRLYNIPAEIVIEEKNGLGFLAEQI